jgi:biotin carboxyl carrier protein
MMHSTSIISSSRALSETFATMRELGISDRRVLDSILRETLAQNPHRRKPKRANAASKQPSRRSVKAGSPRGSTWSRRKPKLRWSSKTSCRPGTLAARAPLPANVWQVLARPGEQVEGGAKLVILQAMKMEIPVTASASGAIEEILCAPGQLVSPGQALCLIKT